MPMKRLRLSALCLGLLAMGGAWAMEYPLPPPGEDMVGRPTWTPVRPKENLAIVAYRSGHGFRQVIHANKNLDAWQPRVGAHVMLPSQLLLPSSAPREGIVVNVPEMRLYYYPKDKAVVHVYPIAVGRVDWKTPVGVTHVRAKVRDPIWYPPESIRREHARMGDPLEKAVPAGPDNPLGLYALRLGWPDVLIHGTNKPMGGIGMPVTHGCVRMYPRDIKAMFEMAPEGTPVRFIDEQNKLGRHNGRWYLEAHATIEQDPHAAVTVAQVVPALVKLKAQPARRDASAPDWDLVKQELYRSSGLPAPVQTKTPGNSKEIARRS